MATQSELFAKWKNTTDTSVADWSEDKETGTEHGKIHSRLGGGKDFYGEKNVHTSWEQAYKYARYREKEGDTRSYAGHRDRAKALTKSNKLKDTGVYRTGKEHDRHVTLHRDEEKHTAKDYESKAKKGHTHDKEKKTTIKSFSQSETKTPGRRIEASRRAKKVATVSAPKNNTRTSGLVRDKIRDRSQTRRRGLGKSTIPGWNLTG